METKIKIIQEIENLCKKADQTRSIFNMMRDRITLINKIFLLYVTIGSAISAMLIFASVPSTYITFIGIFSATIFIVSLVPNALNFDSKILEKTLAIKAWGEWIRDAKNFCNTDISQIEVTALDKKQKELITSYKKVMGNTPLIPDNKFNKYKRLHLQKINISKALDKNPFKTIREIKRNLKNEPNKS